METISIPNQPLKFTGSDGSTILEGDILDIHFALTSAMSEARELHGDQQQFALFKACLPTFNAMMECDLSAGQLFRIFTEVSAIMKEQKKSTSTTPE